MTAKEFITEEIFEDKKPNLYNAEEIFDKLMLIIERQFIKKSEL